MDENIKSYRESLFQWIWQNLEFDCRRLKTVCGKSVTITDPGTINHGAGPDFLRANIVIDGKSWHGSVEIHKTTSEWNAHHHQRDLNFNNVVLHVVYADTHQKIYRHDGTEPFTLCLQPHLGKSLNQLLSLRNESTLPCGKNISFVNQKAFEKQIEIAHKEYFNTKVNELLRDFNPHFPISEAWKQSLISGLYSVLGIPANRDQMKQLAGYLFEGNPEPANLYGFVDLAEKKAGALKTGIRWNHSGMRPASRPANRIPQAAALHHQILTLPFRKFLHSGTDTWQELISDIPSNLQPGKTRMSILRNTVFLPAIYLLGDLFHSRKLMDEAFTRWQSPPQAIPPEIADPFRKAGFSIPKASRKLGLAHQYKRYCLQHQCQRCEVFKNAIRS